MFRKKYSGDVIFGILIITFLCTGGYLLYSSQKKGLTALDKVEQLLVVRLSEYPDRKANSYSFRAVITEAGNGSSRIKPRGSVLLYFMTDSLEQEWQPGDRLIVRTTPLPVENNGNPCEFNYRRYMEGQGVRYFGFFNGEDLIEFTKAGRRNIREASLVVARRMIDIFSESGLEGEDLGLITALTIGDKDLLDKDLLTSFSRTGAMHIMAVSGLHVGMISLLLSYILFFLKRRFIILKVIIILVLLWAFAFVTGLSPSVLRATIMFSFLQAGTLLDRPGNSMNILLASAFILVAFRPAVLFEAGFQLSYLAVAFIIAFYEPLYRLLRLKNKIADYLWQMVAVSVVAQAGTLAMTIHLFNTFPLLFLITNIVVIPVSFIVLVFAFLLTMFASFHPAGILIAKALKLLSGFTIGFTSRAASLPHGVIENIGLSTSETILLTVTIALLLTSLLRVKKITLKPFLVASSLLLICNLYKTSGESRKEKEITYNIKGKEVKALQAGRHLYILSDEKTVPQEIRKHAATRGLTIDKKQVR